MQAVWFHVDSRHAAVEHQADDGSRQGNPDVGTELVLHLAAERLRSHNRCVGDETQVVAKVRAANDNGHHHGRLRPCLLGHTACYGDKGSYRSDARSRTERDETGCEEKASQHKAGRDSCEGQVDSRIDGSHLLCCGSKGSCQDEDPEHLHDARCSGSVGKVGETLAHALAPDDEQAVERCNKESYRERHGIEVVCCKTQEQIKQQKDKERTQSKHALFVRNFSFHAAKLRIFPQYPCVFA